MNNILFLKVYFGKADRVNGSKKSDERERTQNIVCHVFDASKNELMISAYQRLSANRKERGEKESPEKRRQRNKESQEEIMESCVKVGANTGILLANEIKKVHNGSSPKIDLIFNLNRKIIFGADKKPIVKNSEILNERFTGKFKKTFTNILREEKLNIIDMCDS